MSTTRFRQAVKATLDKVIHDLAVAGGYAYLDLDAAALAPDTLVNENPTITWSLLSLSESPCDPMYSFEFEVGAKTSLDPAQRISMDIIGLLGSVFQYGGTVTVMDYTGAVAPTEVLGSLVVSVVSQMPAQYDQTSGYRMVRVAGSGLRVA